MLSHTVRPLNARQISRGALTSKLADNPLLNWQLLLLALLNCVSGNNFSSIWCCCRAAIGSESEDGSKKFVIRPYTPTSAKDAKGYFDLVVKVYEQGKMSKHFGELKVCTFACSKELDSHFCSAEVSCDSHRRVASS